MYTKFIIFIIFIFSIFFSKTIYANQTNIAILMGLDKVTARVSKFNAPESKHVKFGTLRILARACKKRPPEETPETSVFLEIIDLRPGGSPKKVFTGWMFASSPALSSLEHPTYDVWVIDCKTVSKSK
ncbi:DUF2155 domain-containing protein [Alphaproteobacteria bacterium]|nr:DUF2155 domain-containing protein [Alphaproteobacteria bacterium]